MPPARLVVTMVAAARSIAESGAASARMLRTLRILVRGSSARRIRRHSQNRPRPMAKSAVAPATTPRKVSSRRGPGQHPGDRRPGQQRGDPHATRRRGQVERHQDHDGRGVRLRFDDRVRTAAEPDDQEDQDGYRHGERDEADLGDVGERERHGPELLGACHEDDTEGDEGGQAQEGVLDGPSSCAHRQPRHQHDPSGELTVT